MKNEAKISAVDIDYLFSPASIRDRADEIFALTQRGKTGFVYHPEKLATVVDFVIEVIRRNYPSLDVPIHSRWSHFNAGEVDRIDLLTDRLIGLDRLEKARAKIDLVVTSVLLDAGAGEKWSFQEPALRKSFTRSEGLAIASLNMFLAGTLSSEAGKLQADAVGLKKFTAADLKKHFQVSAQNPLVGIEGRVQLLNSLGERLASGLAFTSKGAGPGRPGDILDHLVAQHPKTIPASAILRTVLEAFGPIWPGRLHANGINLGDVWHYPKLDTLVPFHKLSQWMTYSLLEPIMDAGFKVSGVEDLTGLPEYRNGGLMLDMGLLVLRNASDSKKKWTAGSDLVIEWRALTVQLLDMIAIDVQQGLGKSAQEFPLAKVLQGGTWLAGRLLAGEKRPNGAPPLQIESDGTVF